MERTGGSLPSHAGLEARTPPRAADKGGLSIVVDRCVSGGFSAGSLGVQSPVTRIAQLTCRAAFVEREAVHSRAEHLAVCVWVVLVTGNGTVAGVIRAHFVLSYTLLALTLTCAFAADSRCAGTGCHQRFGVLVERSICYPIYMILNAAPCWCSGVNNSPLVPNAMGP